jgi:hypothetical protein
MSYNPVAGIHRDAYSHAFKRQKSFIAQTFAWRQEQEKRKEYQEPVHYPLPVIRA